MNIIERLRAAARAFVLGPSVIQPGDEAWGHPTEQHAPAEYGEYIATSNGVYACATSRAQFLSSLPLELYKLNSQGERVEVTGGNLYGLLQNVNPFWTGPRLIEMTELCLCLWGQCFWFLERGESGIQRPQEIWWGRPDKVRVIPHPSEYIKGYFYLPDNGGRDVFYRPNEVIWLRYPNPMDEYAPLSPLAAAKLAADYASAAMKSNKNLYDNGIQIGGIVSPRSGGSFTEDQARAIEAALERRFKGVDKAHRWGVFRFDAEVKGASQIGFNPREAEFLGGLKLALEDIARAYKWPLDLLGGQRTYENVNAAMKAAWTNCVIPESRFIAAEITEQLLPMFPNEADLAVFGTSDIDVLQEEVNARWDREREQIAAGTIKINEWRDKQGLEPLPWGNVWWASATMVPIKDAELVVPAPVDETAEQEEPARTFARAIVYGSPEHTRLFEQFVSRSNPGEKRLTDTVVSLFKRQTDSILSRLKARAARSPSDVLDEPFDMAQWTREFRREIRPTLQAIVQAAGENGIKDVGAPVIFNVYNPAVKRFLELRAQRFAKRVNDTTWEILRASLNDGIGAGENIAQLEQRVLAVMDGRIRSTPETIARTEVIGAMNGGTLEGWKQSGVVKQKVWLAALDTRTRPSHIDAHGQTVGLNEDFTVGAGKAAAPGQVGLPEEDINCRCSMTAVVE